MRSRAKTSGRTMMLLMARLVFEREEHEPLRRAGALARDDRARHSDRRPAARAGRSDARSTPRSDNSRRRQCHRVRPDRQVRDPRSPHEAFGEGHRGQRAGIRREREAEEVFLSLSPLASRLQRGFSCRPHRPLDLPERLSPVMAEALRRISASVASSSR